MQRNAAWTNDSMSLLVSASQKRLDSPARFTMYHLDDEDVHT